MKRGREEEEKKRKRAKKRETRFAGSVAARFKHISANMPFLLPCQTLIFNNNKNYIYIYGAIPHKIYQPVALYVININISMTITNTTQANCEVYQMAHHSTKQTGTTTRTQVR